MHYHASKLVGVFIFLIRRKTSIIWALFSNLYGTTLDSIEMLDITPINAILYWKAANLVL